MNRFLNTSGVCGIAASQVNRIGANGSGAIPRRKQPLSGALRSPIQAQQFQQFFGQQGLPVLAAFALAHPQDVTTRIDVGRLELSRLRDTQSAAVQHREHSAVAKLGRRLQ
jgi:hypothetical protein